MKTVRLIIGIAFALSFYMLSASNDWFSPLSFKIFDLGVSARDYSGRQSDIVVIEITPDCLSRYFPDPHYPISRNLDQFTRILMTFEQHRPRLVVFDVLFDFYDSSAVDDLNVFCDELRRLGKVILPATVERVPIADSYVARKDSLILPIPAIREAAYRIGIVNLPVDGDGCIRRYYYNKSYRSEVIYSLACQVLREKVSVEEIDCFANETFYIDYSWQSAGIAKVSYSDYIETPALASLCEGKVVFVGVNSPEFSDRYLTPLGTTNNGQENLSGVQIHGLATQTVLAGTGIRKASGLVTFLAFGLLVSLLAIVVYRARIAVGILITVLGFVLILLLGLLSVVFFNMYFPTGVVAVSTTAALVVFGFLKSSIVITTAEQQSRIKDNHISQLEEKNRIITETKTALEIEHQRLKDTQARLIQSEKMASLGMLAAGIAHEVNSPLGGITSMNQTLLSGLGKVRDHCADNARDDDSRQRLERILTMMEQANKTVGDGAARVAEIVNRLKSFAGLDEAEIQEVDINEALDNTLSLVSGRLKQGVEIVKEYGRLPRLSCHAANLNQVFLNLVLNANDPIESVGQITVRTAVEDASIHISISDTGAGIPEENRSKIFDPGFTTKGVKVGTGLGLAICYQIVKEHNGDILVESQKGKGSTFTVVLPLGAADGGVNRILS
ncbi:MAG: CHASE2 domain-containing protein [Candidatus Zixiibacteriota bacterium]|nr:MAG: CHASE2 domain-containing protein [candidate division Zixibacteria bacterium]